MKANLAKIATGVMTALGLLTMSTTVGSANPNISYIGPGVRYANQPEGVRCVQRAVGVKEDGQYGPITYTAVKRFQKTHRLMVDGIVGPRTGDLILLSLPDDVRFDCAKVVPSTFILMDDDGRTAEGHRVYNYFESGHAGTMGKPIGTCVVEGVKGSVFGAGRLVKVVWKRRLPTPEQLLAAPNPLKFTGGMLYCKMFAHPN